MDEGAKFLGIFFVVLVAIGFIGYGIAWVVANAWPYLLLAAIIAIVVVVYRVKGRTLDKSARTEAVSTRTSVQAAGVRAAAMVEALATSRREVELESQRLRQIREAARQNLSFQVVVQRHHESRLIADRWYQQKKSATNTRGEVSSGLEQLRDGKRRLARIRDRSHGSARASAVAELLDVQLVIDQVYAALSALSREIQRGQTAVDNHNQETGQLRDYIRDNFGRGGRTWYENLQARKSARRR